MIVVEVVNRLTWGSSDSGFRWASSLYVFRLFSKLLEAGMKHTRHETHPQHEYLSNITTTNWNWLVSPWDSFLHLCIWVNRRVIPAPKLHRLLKALLVHGLLDFLRLRKEKQITVSTVPLGTLPVSQSEGLELSLLGWRHSDVSIVRRSVECDPGGPLFVETKQKQASCVPVHSWDAGCGLQQRHLFSVFY